MLHNILDDREGLLVSDVFVATVFGVLSALAALTERAAVRSHALPAVRSRRPRSSSRCCLSTSFTGWCQPSPYFLLLYNLLPLLSSSLVPFLAFLYLFTVNPRILVVWESWKATLCSCRNTGLRRCRPAPHGCRPNGLGGFRSAGLSSSGWLAATMARCLGWHRHHGLLAKSNTGNQLFVLSLSIQRTGAC